MAMRNTAQERPYLEKLMTTREVAELLQLHAKSVERMARRGRLPSLRVCGRVRFRPSDIASWLAARRTACHDS
jgi:excisionase family DNA binding protein